MKRNIVKRIATVALAIAMALTVVPAMPAKAADDIVEMNGTMNQELQIPATITSPSVTRYLVKYIAPDDGYCTVDLTSDQGEDAMVFLVAWDENYKWISDFYGTTTYGISMHLDSFAVSRGRAYYIEMYANAANKSNIQSAVLTLKCNFTKSDLWEKENNDSSTTATPMENGKSYSGHADSTYHGDVDVADHDCFKFTLTKDSQVTINVGPQRIGNESHFDAYLYNDDAQNKGIAWNVSSKSVNTGYLKKGTYYIMIRGTANSSNRYNIDYAVSYSASPIKVPKTAAIQSVAANSSWDGFELNEIDITNARKAVTGYRVKVAKSKKMKGTLLDENISTEYPDRIITSRKIEYPGKTVYVTAQPYISDFFGNEIWLKRSAAKKVKIG